MDEEKKEGDNGYKKSEEGQDTKPIDYKKPIENNSNSEKPSEKSFKPKQSLTDKFRGNPFILSTIVCGVLALLLLVAVTSGGITGNVVSSNVAGENLVEFLNTIADSEVTLIDVENDGDFYKVIIEFKGQEMPVYVTKDGSRYTSTLIPLVSAEEEAEDISKEPISECVEPYGVNLDTIIFYYSDSCGWCAKMKPGVEALEKEGYNFYWIDGSDAEGVELIDNCVRSHMTSGGVPQFICPKTNEIHVGAFTDENRDLDQLALKEWVDACISD